MKVRRRNFLVTLGASIGTLEAFRFFNRKKTKRYEVTFTCKIKGAKKLDFFKERDKWEHKEKVIELCRKYEIQGKLLSYSYQEDKASFKKWVYIFDSRNSYEAWSKEIFLNGYFKHDKINSSFEYSVKGRYV